MEFCPGCGKKSKGICRDCRPKKQIKVKDILIKICSGCKKYFYKNTWHNYRDLDAVIKKITKDSVKEKVDSAIPLDYELKRKPGVNLDIGVEATIGEDVFLLPASIEVTYCNICSKKQGDYFEGILQLRNPNMKLIGYVHSYCKKNNMLVNEKKAKNGLDIKITDRRKIQELGHNLQKQFGGTLKINPQTYSKDRQTSKVIYRVNVLYEAPDYQKGDVIKQENKLVLIKGLGKNITGIDLKTGKKTSIAPKDYKVLKSKKTTISKVSPNLEILHPETYQSVAVENPKKLNHGEKVKAVEDSGLFYLA